jgi:hypothetical protein
MKKKVTKMEGDVSKISIIEKDMIEIKGDVSQMKEKVT